MTMDGWTLYGGPRFRRVGTLLCTVLGISWVVPGIAASTDFLGNPFITNQAPQLNFETRVAPNRYGIDYTFAEQTAKGVALFSRFPAFSMSDRRMHVSGPWYNSNSVNGHFTHGITSIEAMPNFRQDGSPTDVRLLPHTQKWKLITDPSWYIHASNFAMTIQGSNPSDPRLYALWQLATNHVMVADSNAYITLGMNYWLQERATTDTNQQGSKYAMIDIETTGGWENQRDCLGWLYDGMIKAARSNGVALVPVTYGQWTFEVGAVYNSYRVNSTGEPDYLSSNKDFLAGNDPTLAACTNANGAISMDGYLQSVWGYEPIYKRDGNGNLILSGGQPVFNDITNTTVYGQQLLLEPEESRKSVEEMYRQAVRMYLMHHRMAGTYPTNSTMRRSHLQNTRVGAWTRFSNEGVNGTEQNDRPLPGWQIEMLNGLYLMTADDIVAWSSDFNHPPTGVGANNTNYWNYDLQGEVEYFVKAAHRYSARDPIHTGSYQWCWFSLPMINGNTTDGDRYYQKPIAVGKLRTYNGQPWIEMYVAWPTLDDDSSDMKLWINKGTNLTGSYTLSLTNGRSYFYDAWQLPSSCSNLVGSNVWLQFRDQLGTVRTWRGDWRVSVTGAVTAPADVDAGGTRFVSPSGSSIAPYTNLAMAATSIQAAVNVALSGETVVVAPGIYSAGAASITNMVLITNAITLRASSSDPSVTVIDGGGTRRGIYMTAPAYIQGFTLRNCRADSGAGIVGTNGGDIRQCVITNNVATNGHGGGVNLAGGLLRNCLIACNIATNAANTRDGGGAYLYGGIVENCTIVKNYAGRNGSGLMLDRRAAAENRIENSIVYYNRGPSTDIVATNTPVAGLLTLRYTCSPSLSHGVDGNRNDVPRFWDLVSGNYRLAGDSPCRSSATNLDWMLWAVDLTGTLRVQDGGPDMGAYESPPYRYVATNSSAPTSPYTSWTTAANSIQAAIAASTPGDTIMVRAGVYGLASGPADSSNLVVLTNGVMLLAEDADASQTILDGGNSRRVISMSYPSVVAGFTLRNGYALGDGAGVWMKGGELRSCMVVSNMAVNGQGGGVMATGGCVRSCLILGNVATNGSNQADGGGIVSVGAAIQNCTITGNRCGRNGGGILFDRRAGTSNVLQNSIVWHNSGLAADMGVTNSGGGLAQWYSCSPGLSAGLNGNLTNEPVFRSRALGDFRLAYGSPCLNQGSVLEEMTPDVNGLTRIIGTGSDMGALEAKLFRFALPANPGAVAPYTNWTTAASGIQPAIDASEAGETIILGAGVYGTSMGPVDQTNLVRLTSGIYMRSATTNPLDVVLDGGGLYRSLRMEALSSLEGITVRNGIASDGGGGIYMEGFATITRCSVTNNKASDGHGGGILAGSGLIRNCLLAWNIATNLANDRSGGGIYFGGLSQAGGRIENCTVVGNAAGDDGSGIFLDNRAATGVIINCIVYGNNGARQSTKDLEYGKGTNPVTIAYNCASNLVAGIDQNISASPQFLAGTFRPSSNSPCLGRGLSFEWMTADGVDFLAAARVQGGGVDLGAWESGWAVPVPISMGWSIAAADDDAEEDSAGLMVLNSGDLDLGGYTSATQRMGLRFTGLPIPRNATIMWAFVQFMADETNDQPCFVEIQGENVDHSAAFKTNTWNLTGRPLTVAKTTWNPPAWGNYQGSDDSHRTPELRMIIQEIVARTGWTSNNAISLIFKGTGPRAAESREAMGTGTNPPMLYVEWTTNVFNGDSDGDGMSDLWETGYFGGTSTTNGGAGSDADGDKLSNFSEFIAGTDPLSSGSTLELQMTNVANPRIIRWNSSAGRIYTLHSRTNLADAGWVTMTTNISSSYPSMNVYTDNVHVGATRRIYRIRARLANP